MKHRSLALISVVALLLVGPLVAQNESRDALPVPDVAPYKTLKGDFHLHTVFSDGRVWPTVQVREAWRDGLDVIALTDHAEYHPNAPDVRVDGNRAYEVAKPIADQFGIILIRGVEITKPDPPAPAVLPEGSAHFNALFVSDANALNTPDLMQSLRAAKAQRAFVFWNHPRYGVARAEWFRPIARAYDEGLFQGMELVNGPDFYEEAYPWIAERNLTILATSDGHDPMPPRASGFRRPITLLFVRFADVEGVRDALEARRTAAWLGDDVWGPEELLKGLWDGAIGVRAEVRRTPGAGPTIVFRNASAIPMRVRIRQRPDWMRGGSGLVPAQGELAMAVGLEKSAPAVADFTIELDVVNLHTAPDRNLVVRVRLRTQLVDAAR
jgi:3',5'-nucleoside bisphosphate phosphatase